MDEELNQILTNEEMDANARAEAIKSLIGKDYIPVAKHTEKIKKEHENFKNLQNEYKRFRSNNSEIFYIYNSTGINSFGVLQCFDKIYYQRIYKFLFMFFVFCLF